MRVVLLIGTAVCGALFTGLPHAAAAEAGLSEAEQAAVFQAAGAVRKGRMWVVCADDPNPSGASIDSVRDLNGDGRPEAVVVEGGTFCHGHTGTGYTLLSKRADDGWTALSSGSGIPLFLESRGKDGWPDLEVGGPGFCFPVLRWNGRAYVYHRDEYEGRPCQ